MAFMNKTCIKKIIPKTYTMLFLLLYFIILVLLNPVVVNEFVFWLLFSAQPRQIFFFSSSTHPFPLSLILIFCTASFLVPDSI